MNTLQLDYDEGIILENEDVYWASRDDLELTNFTLTNKNLYCTYEKDNGFFKKSTSEMCVLALSDIKIINGQALVQQVKYEGSWCIQIQFRQGVEYFSFSSSPKKVIPQWIAEINRIIIGSPEQIFEQPVETKKKSSVLVGFGGITANLRSVADSAALAVTSTVKQASETINHHSVSTEEPTYTPAPETVSAHTEPQHQGAKFCSNCGTPINAGAKFCHGCGTPIGVSNVPTPPPVTQTAPPPVPLATEQEQQPKRVERRQQEFVGTVLKCPNCGGVIGETTAVCPECGIRITGRSAVTSVQSFKEQLMAIEGTRKRGLGGVFGVYTAPDPADTKKLSLIRSFPIPNSVDDIMEFMFLAVANIDVSLSKNTAMNKWNSTQQVETGATIGKTISNAWVAKMQQAYQKAEIMFPNDSAFPGIQKIYYDKMKELKIKV